ncbi:MAG: OmpP1/FadL family transporter [Bacteriovoracia bacterium]
MKIISLFVLAFGFSSLAHAAGFEKAVLWSGKEAGSGSAGMSRISSSESLYFNPAGLAGGGTGGDFTLNVSPTSIKLQGSIASAAVNEETDKNYSTIGSGFVKYKVNERLGVGVGAYVSGGSKAIYENVSLASDQPTITAFTPTIRTELAIIEYSVGAAYEIIPGLRFGAAWRIAKVDGGFSTVKKTIANTAYSFIDIADAKQTRYNGYRLGLQYENDAKTWGVGATFRNSMNFSAVGNGTGSTTVIPTTITTATTIGKTTLGTGLPWSASLGGNVLVNEDFRLLAAVDMMKYSENKQLTIVGTINGTTVIPNLPLNWKDMYNYRLGGEYLGIETVVLKAGYVLTTPVTPTHDARATLAPPGTGHTVTLGAGKTFLRNTVSVDGAFEYAFNNAGGSASPTYATDTTKELLATSSSEYKAKVMALHLGASYRF